MTKQRRQFGGKFKFQVALEAAKGQKTMSELASEHSLHPTQIREWKQKLLEEGPDIYSDPRCQDRKRVDLR